MVSRQFLNVGLAETHQDECYCSFQQQVHCFDIIVAEQCEALAEGHGLVANGT
jgi:hypothetical protein